ncbi:hypothetical protein Tco_0105582 [Tanacetum coccineum]
MCVPFVMVRRTASSDKSYNPCMISKFAANHFRTTIAFLVSLGGSLEQFLHSSIICHLSFGISQDFEDLFVVVDDVSKDDESANSAP